MRSTLPLLVSGSLSRNTNAAGTMYSGSFVLRCSRSALTSGGGWRADEIRDQTLCAGHVFARHHDSLANDRVLAQHRFDLAELDAEAADLHLMVDAAQILDVASRQKPSQITRSVEPPPRLIR